MGVSASFQQKHSKLQSHNCGTLQMAINVGQLANIQNVVTKQQVISRGLPVKKSELHHYAYFSSAMALKLGKLPNASYIFLEIL